MPKRWIEQINGLTIYYDAETEYSVWSQGVTEKCLKNKMKLDAAEDFCKKHIENPN